MPMKSLWNLSLLIRVSMFDFSVRDRKEFLPYLDESFQEVLKLIQVWTSCVLIGRWMISKPFELKWCGKHCPLRRCLDIQSTLAKKFLWENCITTAPSIGSSPMLLKSEQPLAGNCLRVLMKCCEIGVTNLCLGGSIDTFNLLMLWRSGYVRLVWANGLEFN